MRVEKRFEVGDIVTAIDNTYTITTKGVRCEVLETNYYNILVRLCDKKHRDYDKRGWFVSASRFTAVDINDKEFESILNGFLLQEIMDDAELYVDTMDYAIKFNENGIRVGCQAIAKEDALEIADRIIEAYR